MKIIVDAMGGDNAPDVTVRGAALAAKEYGEDILLVGQPEAITAVLRAHGLENTEHLTIMPASDIVDMHDDPATVLRRKPELRMKSLPTGLEQLQRELLDASAQYVAPGGVLVYSTCTLRRAENEDAACAFLAAHPDFEPYPIPDLPGCELFRGGGGSATFLPGPTDGFFAARFRRKSAEGGERA